jgi:hypothetical protein
MSEADHLATALTLLAKLVRPLSDQDLMSVTSNETKVTLLRPGQVIMQKSKALDAAVKFLEGLSAEELTMLESRQVRLELLRKEDKVIVGLDIPELAGRIVKLAHEDEIVHELNSDSRLVPAMLKRLAKELSIGVPATVKTKPSLQQHIAEAVVRDRGRFAWR